MFWILSVFDNADYAKASAAYTAVFLAFDCFSFLAMMVLFRGGVEKLKPASHSTAEQASVTDSAASLLVLLAHCPCAQARSGLDAPKVLARKRATTG